MRPIWELLIRLFGPALTAQCCWRPTPSTPLVFQPISLCPLFFEMVEPRGEHGPRLLGLASINVDDFDDALIRDHRLSALESHLASGDFIEPNSLMLTKQLHLMILCMTESMRWHRGKVQLCCCIPVFHRFLNLFRSRVHQPIGLEEVIHRFDGTGDEERVEFIVHTHR